MENLDLLKNFVITEKGVIKNHHTGHTYSHCPDSKGYMRVYLTNSKGKRKGYFVHRLIASKYIANPHKKPCVNHKDGDKSNNNINNLEWCTHKENITHARDTLKVKFGTQEGKLRNKMIAVLSERFTQSEISQVFKCTQENINRILRCDGRNNS